MTASDDSTMAASEAAGSAFKDVSRSKKSKRLKTAPVQKIPVQRAHKYTIRAYFPKPRANLKFNPSNSMRLLFVEMLKYDSTITVINDKDDQQLQLNVDAIPTNEADFTKYFTVMQDTRPTNTKPHIIVGCRIMSDRTVREIKFDTTTQTKFIDWLAKEKIFLESDSLGITKTATVGYLLKLHTRITNRTTLKELLHEALSDICIDPELAIELDPTLKAKQVEAMSNGDTFIPEIPKFEIYNTKITLGRDNNKVETFVFGIKCAIEQARLLKEFFTQLGNPMETDTRMGVFLPNGSAHMIGAEAYKKLLCDNNEDLQTITTVPVGDFQHATLEIPFSSDKNTDIDATNLYETILDQPWCISVEKTTTPNKILVVTTKGQVLAAREWIDNTLPDIYHQNIADKLDVTTLQQLTPRRLDKPLITASATRYADQLKQRSTYVSSTASTASQFLRPPKNRSVKPAGLTYAAAAAPKHPPTSNANTPAAAAPSAMTTQTTITSEVPFDYHAEIQRITHDIETKLKAKLEAAIANLQSTVDNLEKKFEQKLNCQIDSLKATQADKTTQDNHSRDLQELAKNVRYLLEQTTRIADNLNIPTPPYGVGRS